MQEEKANKSVEDISVLREKLKEEIHSSKNIKELKQIEQTIFGSKGVLADCLKTLKSVPKEEKSTYGKAINDFKDELKALIESREIEFKELLAKTTTYLDITLPGTDVLAGTIHPVSRAFYRICDIFYSMGFEIVDGPEIEDEWHNFEALNMPPYHPARDEQDTFYLGEQILLRTHTSPVQIRVMEKAIEKLKEADITRLQTGVKDLLIRIISPGNTYRRDKPDRTHTPMFSQVEGLMIGRNITMADMKGILSIFARRFFGEDVRTRLRPDFFPFVEPGGEAAFSCPMCKGIGCRVCKQTGWIELLGCGMVHPAILDRMGIPSRFYQGFAFGMGVERAAQLLYQVEDSRLFFENDWQFLRQFN